jgi:hypothetical protein
MFPFPVAAASLAAGKIAARCSSRAAAEVHVHEALRARRLHTAGRDETTAPVRDAQRDIVRAELADLKRQVKDVLALEDRIFGMLEDLEHALTPLVFELVFEAWTDGQISREILLNYVLIPKLVEAGREVGTIEALRAEVVGKSQAVSRRKVAELRETIVDRPHESRRYAID